MAVKRRKPPAGARTATRKRVTPRRTSGDRRAGAQPRDVTRNPGHIPLSAHAAEERRASAARRLTAAVHDAAAADATRVSRPRRVGAARAGAGRIGSPRPTGSFDPVGEDGERLTSPVRRQPDGDEHCVSFALAAALETWLAWALESTDDLPTLSVDHITSLAGGKKIVTAGAKGVRNGVLEDACFGANPPCPDAASRTWRGSVLQVNDSRPEALCELLKSRKPLVTEMVVFQGFENFTGPGTYIPNGPQTGAHALVIVGFERGADGNGVWIVKNSYGEAWGDGGYGRIRWGDPFCNPESVVFMVKEVTRAV